MLVKQIVLLYLLDILSKVEPELARLEELKIDLALVDDRMKKLETTLVSLAISIDFRDCDSVFDESLKNAIFTIKHIDNFAAIIHKHDPMETITDVCTCLFIVCGCDSCFVSDLAKHLM